nr:MAG TPA: hypothetical protein [Caudoviricetes sp.]
MELNLVRISYLIRWFFRKLGIKNTKMLHM